MKLLALEVNKYLEPHILENISIVKKCLIVLLKLNQNYEAHKVRFNEL